MKKTCFTVFLISSTLFTFAKETNKETTKADSSSTFQPTKELSTVLNEEDDEKTGKLSFSGYLDSYYSMNFNKPLSQSNTGYSGVARVFDTHSGQLMLGMVQTMVTYTNDKSEVVADITFGPNANSANYGNAIASTGLSIKQAYFTYNFTDKFSATVGQFGTHIGYEVIDAPVNFNYSLSYLFGNGPFYHAGIKGTYAFSDRASLMVGFVNNVDGLGDNNRKKGLISQLYLAPAENWNVYLNMINSNEAQPDASSYDDAFYRVFDIATSYEVTEKFLLGLNAATGKQRGDMQGDGNIGTKSWGGVAGYANLALTNNFGLGARYEYFDNSSGVRMLQTVRGGTNVNAVTLTGNINLAGGHILIKPEIRLDSFRKEAAGVEKMFEDSNGNYTKDSQTTFGIGFIYKL